MPDEANVPLQKHGTEDMQTNTHLSEVAIDSSKQNLKLDTIVYVCNKNYCPYTLISLHTALSDFAMLPFSNDKVHLL